MKIFSAREQISILFKDVHYQIPIDDGKDPLKFQTNPLVMWLWFKPKKEHLLVTSPEKDFEVFTYIVDGISKLTNAPAPFPPIFSGEACLISKRSPNSKSEFLLDPYTQGFQLWLQNDQNTNLNNKNTPKIQKMDEFPMVKLNGIHIKYILGHNSPFQTSSGVNFMDIIMRKDTTHSLEIKENKIMYILITSGNGILNNQNVVNGDFIVLRNNKFKRLSITNLSSFFRIAIIETELKETVPKFNKIINFPTIN